MPVLNPRTDRSLGERVGGMLVLGVLLFVAALLAMDTALAERLVLLRMWTLLSGGIFAVAAPHLLLPDRRLPLLQLVNPPPAALLGRGLRRWAPVVALFVLPCLVLAFFDPAAPTAALGAKARAAVAAGLAVAGTGAYAFERYLTIGPRSQAYQEGTQGPLGRALTDHMAGRVGLPPGLLPAVTVTGAVFVAAALAVVAEAALTPVASAWTWVPGLALVAYAGARLLALRRGFDRPFYGTNAFYGEIFRTAGGIRDTEREPLPYGAVYWVPPRLKPHAWAALRQLDRQVPLGRLVALGHLLLWVLAYRDADAGLVAAYLLLFSGAKNAAVYLLATPPLAPPAFQLATQSPAAWAATRFFVNLRWTLPWALSLGVVALFDASYPWPIAAFWTALDVVLAALAALAVTLAAEYRWAREARG